MQLTHDTINNRWIVTIPCSYISTKRHLIFKVTGGYSLNNGAFLVWHELDTAILNYLSTIPNVGHMRNLTTVSLQGNPPNHTLVSYQLSFDKSVDANTFIILYS